MDIKLSLRDLILGVFGGKGINHMEQNKQIIETITDTSVENTFFKKDHFSDFLCVWYFLCM